MRNSILKGMMYDAIDKSQCSDTGTILLLLVIERLDLICFLGLKVDLAKGR